MTDKGSKNIAGSMATNLLDHYRKTHARRVYGTSSVKQIRFLRPWIKLRRPGSILDFGAGQSKFLDALNLPDSIELLRFDPAIPEYATRPDHKVDLLVSIDVLEHIEEPDIPQTLRDMRHLCRDALIVIDTKPAKHLLPDGRNAHVTLRPFEWWQEKLATAFDHVEPIRTMRRSRLGFKTWESGSRERLAYQIYRARENAIHYARRLVGLHKSQWKVSSIGRTVRPEQETERD